MPQMNKNDIEAITHEVIIEEGLDVSEVQISDGVSIPDINEESADKPAVDFEVQSEDGTQIRALIDVSSERDPEQIKEGIRKLLNKRIKE